MTLETDLNQAPYFDDFDENRNYHRILFKPGVAVQARELTQMQTILQNQVERFGSNILTEGTIISGCNFNEIRNLGYVKILDLQNNGAPVSMSTYNGQKAIGRTTGVEAVIVEVAAGLETQTPNLNTIFVKYVNTGENGEKVFSDTETIEIRNIQNEETIADVAAAGTVENNSVGSTYGVRVGSGIIYQKGFFIRVEDQLTIVSKYTNEPDNLTIGFRTVETVVNSNNDTSLQDNAQGYPNANAPGADRVQLTPELVVKTVEEASEDQNYLIIQEYQSGRIVRKNTRTQYSQIFDEVQKRTSEESGDYTVRDFDVNISANQFNNNFLDVNVGAGLAYVEGRRVELINKISIPLEKATSSNTEVQQDISMNYGNYIIVDEMLGNFDFDRAETITLHGSTLDRFSSSGVGSKPGNQVGSANVRAIAYESGTPGTASARYRLYLFNVTMETGSKFDDVRSVFFNGTNKGCANVVVSGKIMKESSFMSSVFEIGRSAIKTLPTTNTDYVYKTANRTLVADGSTGSITINLSGDSEWPYSNGLLNSTQKSEILLVCNSTQAPYTAGKHIDLTNATVEVTSSQSMTITLNNVPANDMDVIAYFNAKRTNVTPAGKDLKTIFVKIDASSVGDKNNICLGVPDAHEIVGVWRGSDYSESNSDVTSKFRLFKNDSSSVYGLSKIRPNSGYNMGSDKYLVKVKVFKRNTTGSFSRGYFCVDSYPIDDANTANTAAITTQEIPQFESNGKLYDLRDCVDFRFQVSNTAAYAETVSAATVNPQNSYNVESSETYFPAPNETFETDYEYYMGRQDLVIIDGDGNFEILYGEPSDNPKPPTEPAKGLILASLNVPPFPSLPKRVADRSGKSSYGVTMKTRDNKRYTMRDIGGIERRLDSLEYYTVLNSLEQDAINMLVTDDNGATRFKNGIFVDNFSNLKIANLDSPEYSAGIDPSETEITPRFKAFNLDLRPTNVSGWSNANLNDLNVAHLSVSDTSPLVNQLATTGSRNCVTDFYTYTGKAKLVPSYDSGYDTSRAPDVTLDISEAFSQFSEALNEFVPLNQSETNRRRNTTDWTDSDRNNWSEQRTVTTRTTTSSRALNVSQGRTKPVGDFVTNVSFEPFLRSKVLRFRVTGLRPNTRHYFFFDGKEVNEHVAEGETPKWIYQIYRTSRFGNAIKSDSRGRIFGLFRIPEEEFHVGERKLEIMDVARYNDRDTATSRSQVSYHGFNYNVERAGLSTQMPQISVESDVSVEEDSFLELRRGFTPPGDDDMNNGNFTPGIFGLFGGEDPIAQTFFVESNVSRDNAVFIDSVRLWFETKSDTAGITVSIHETQNGYPSKNVIPLATCHKEPEDVAVSLTSRAPDYTEFEFDAPIALRTGREYAIVVKPDGNSPDYRVFVSRTGERTINNGTPMTKDNSSGTLFTSTNNRAWTAYQDENMKFAVRRMHFDANSGRIEMTNKDHEFFTVDTVSGKFREGERVGAIKQQLGGSVNYTRGSKILTGNNTSFNQLEIGDFIALKWSTGYDFCEVESILSNTQIRLKNTPTETKASAAFYRSVVGDLTYINTNDPAKMILENSSAKTNQYFEVGDTLVGDISEAEAEIVSVDNQNVSYYQANIQRVNTTKTKTSITGQRLTNEDGSTFSKGMSFGENVYLNGSKSVVIKSRSNEVKDGSGDSFKLKVDFANKDNSTPVVDIDISNVMIYEYEINNDNSGETGVNGNASTKYVSRTIQLADGMDADDMKVILTSYRPSGTDVEVYVRFQSDLDPRDFESIEWTKLEKKSETNGYSSNANRFDFKEFEYNVPVKSDGNINNGGGAALNSNNNDIIRYRDDEGAVYDRYKNYAIKIVMLSNRHGAVPRIRDVRGIALS